MHVSPTRADFGIRLTASSSSSSSSSFPYRLLLYNYIAEKILVGVLVRVNVQQKGGEGGIRLLCH